MEHPETPSVVSLETFTEFLTVKLKSVFRRVR